MYLNSMSIPSDITVDTWVRLLRAHNASLAAVDAALKRAGLPPLTWYDVLLELERGGDAGLRPFELQTSLLLPQYGVSRLIDRIEKAGYLKKMDCVEDGRGQVLIITPTGCELRRSMWLVYGPAIERVVGNKLTLGEVRILHRILGKLLPEDR